MHGELTSDSPQMNQNLTYTVRPVLALRQELRLATRQLEGTRGDGLRHKAKGDRWANFFSGLVESCVLAVFF